MMSPFQFNHSSNDPRELLQKAQSFYEEGKALHDKRDFRGAMDAFHQSLSIQEPHLGKYHWDTIKTYVRIGENHWALAHDSTDNDVALEKQAAVRSWKRSLRLAEKLNGKDHPKTKNLLKNISSFLESNEEEKGTKKTTTTPNFLNAIERSLEYEREGDSLTKRSKYSRALKKYREAMKVEQDFFTIVIPDEMDTTSTSTTSSFASTYSLDGADILCKLGHCYKLQGSYKESVAALSCAAKCYTETLGDDHPASMGAQSNLRNLRRSMTSSSTRSSWGKRLSVSLSFSTKRRRRSSSSRRQ